MIADAGTVRKVLIAGIAAALVSTPAAAEVRLDCNEYEEWCGLFCTGEQAGQPIEFCDEGGGNCTVSCGVGVVPVDCECDR